MINNNSNEISRYVIYDFETTGRNPNWDQIIQVGAVLVDGNLNIKDSFEIRSFLKPGLIPHPKALLVNNTSPEMLLKSNENYSHYQMIRKVVNKFNEWAPAIFMGYNSISFDEEFLRKSLFKSLFDPFFTTSNNNQRCDILNIVRNSTIYFPEALHWEINEKGNPILKLEELTKKNNLSHNAHDALGDVFATREIAKILKHKASDLWETGVKNNKKYDVINKVKKELLFCYNEFFYGAPYPLVLSYLCDHTYPTYLICFDLRNDPLIYFNMSKDDLKMEMKKSPKFLRTIKTNKNPIIFDYKNYIKFENYRDFDENLLIERAEILKQNSEFKEKIYFLIEESNKLKEEETNLNQAQVPPEERIYEKFLSNKDRQIIQRFHEIDNWNLKLNISYEFEDSKLGYFGRRMIYEEVPESLPEDLLKEIHQKIAEQVLSPYDEKWYTIPQARKDSDDLKVKYEDENDNENLEKLEKFDLLIDKIENKFEKY